MVYGVGWHGQVLLPVGNRRYAHGQEYLPMSPELRTRYRGTGRAGGGLVKWARLIFGGNVDPFGFGLE